MAFRSDWRRARAERRADERRLPEGLRKNVGVVRRDDLGHDEAQSVLDYVKVIALRQGDLRAVRSAGAPSWSYVPPAVERDILRQLEQNPSYRNRMRASVRTTLRTAHLAKVDPDAALLTLPEWLGPSSVVENGVLTVRSSIGLGTATVLEAEPEGWDHWAACNVFERHECVDDAEVSVGLDQRPDRSVLVLGALAGGLARAITATGGANITITEVDWVLPDARQATKLPCVERRGLSDPMGVFDAAVAVFPSAATSGTANQRNIYGQTFGDPARLGVRRWERAIIGYLGLLNVALELGSFAYVLLPLGVRHAQGYAAAPELLHRVLCSLDSVGFKVTANIPTIEVVPVAQPFVGRARPPKVTLVLKKIHAVEGI